jgi:hypothetical protein
MKTGKTLAELAAELDRQSRAKHDYIADTRRLDVAVRDDKPVLVMQDRQFEISDIAHGQIAEHTKIPKPYYDRMAKEAPGLLANNVKTWFDKYPAERMIRTLDDRNRAFLSNSFRPLDNYDFGQVILGACAERKLEIVSADITERKLYIKAIDKQEFQVPIGYKMGDGSHRIFDVCCPVFIASNSEVGFGRLSLDTGVYTHACTNLAWFTDGGMKKTHLGSRHKIVEATGVESIDHLLSDKTRQKSDEALWMQLRDVLGAAFDGKRIENRTERLASAATKKIGGDVPKMIELVRTNFGLTETEGGNVLRHLIEGGSLTQYGLHAAVTRAAQDSADYDRATELEYLGGRIIDLPQTEWAVLADAA